MDTDKLKVNSLNAVFKGTLMTAIALSMGVCTGNMLLSAVVAGVLAAVAYVIKPETSLLPMFLSFTVILSAVNTVGPEGAIIVMILSGLMVLISGKLTSIRAGINSPSFLPAIMISAALTITVLITNDYFGIGASGNTVIQMLKSYRSFGFHPNWRGILYGTIVMVIMITYPRKFKKASKIVSAAFVAVIATYLLNLVLVPRGSVETFRMIGTPDLEVYSIRDIPGIKASGISSVLYILLYAFAETCTFIIAVSDEEYEKKTNLYAGTMGVLVMPALFGYTYPGKVAKSAEEMLPGLISAAIMAACYFPTKLFARLPVASCAVVLIVGIWQQVKWGKLKDAFSSVPRAAIFIIIVAISLLTNMAAGLVAGLLICSVYQKSKEMRAAQN